MPDQTDTPKSETPGLLDGVESAGKVVAGVVGLLYLLGVLIENIHLASMGIYDFAILQPRYVLVGLDFIIYLALPLALILIPLSVIRFDLLGRLCGRTFSLWVRVGLAAALAILLYLLLPVPFNYFVSKLSWLPFTQLPLQAWGYYVHPTWMVGVVLLYAPAVALLLRIPKVNRTWLLVLMGIGVLSDFVPYVSFVLPNINRAMGGGCPQVVEIDLEGAPLRKRDDRMYGVPAYVVPSYDLLRKLVPPATRPTTQSSEPALDREPVLLWHESEKFLYVSKMIGWESLSPLVAVPKDKVSRITYWHAVLEFEAGSLKQAVVIPDIEDASRAFDEALRRLNESPTGAARRPSTQPTSNPTTKP